MRVEVLDGLGRPTVLPATRVLVTDDNGTPIAFAFTFVKDAAGREITRVGHAGEPDFTAQLRAHGVDRTVVVTHMPAPEKG